MRAVTFSHSGAARDVLHVVDRPVPEPGPGEVRVKIAASGVNPSDVKRRGAKPDGSPAEFPLVIPHSDGAGTIDAVGSGVPASRIGERVWTSNAQFERPFGTAAEFCVVPSSFAVRLPDSIDFATGACLGVPVLTAYHAVMLDGSVRGQTILVQGGAGSVAFYAIQMAKADGAMVIATVSSPEKAAHARAGGADHTIDYKREDVGKRIRELTGGHGIRRVIEVDLSANAPTYGAILADSAKVVVYGSGGVAPLPPLIRLQTTVQFFVVYKLVDAVRLAHVAAVTALLERGTLRHAIAARFPLENIVEAHEATESGKLMGHVVVDVGDAA
jgi:NADPH2:quinone reductase